MHLLSEKPTLLVIVSRFPYPLEKGDKLRAYYQLKELSVQYNVSLIAISSKKIDPDHLQQLAPFCTEIHIIRITFLSIALNVFRCFFNRNPFQVGYFYSFRGHLKVNRLLERIRPDAIYCQLIRVSEYVKNYHLCPKTLDYMDALSMGVERRIALVPWYEKWLFKSEAKRLREYERSIFDYFEHKTIISKQDRELILHPDKSQIKSIPNGIDARFFDTPSCEKKYDLVFVGNLSYAPNIEASSFIFSQILAKNTSLTCLISGATPHPSIVKMSEKSSQLTLQYWIPDIRTAYSEGKIFVAPMFIGTGMQNKLLEAMALGIPCVTTDLANNALNAIHEESIYVANTPDEFLEAIERLLHDEILYRKIAANGRSFVKELFEWKNVTQPLTGLLLYRS